MKIEYDPDVDAMYIEFQDGEFGSNKKIDDLTIIDYDKKGKILGIELLKISDRIPKSSLSEVNVKNLVLAKN